MKSAITITGNKFSIAQKDIEYSDIEGSMEDKATIYWKWDGSATDEKDKELGEAATVGTIGLTMTAEQLIK